MEEQQDKTQPNSLKKQQPQLFETRPPNNKKQSFRISKSITNQQRKDWVKRFTLNQLQSLNTFGKQNKIKKGRRTGSQCVFELPKLKQLLVNKNRDQQPIFETNCTFAQSGLSQNNRRESTLKKQRISTDNTIFLSRNLKQMPIFPALRQNLTQRRQYIDRLNIIRQQGVELQKQTTQMLIKTRQAQNVIDKNYVKLRKNSNTIITGVEEYRLEEEQSQIYKNQIMNMWMKCHR